MALALVVVVRARAPSEDGHALEAWALIGTGLSHADPSIRERAVAALGRAAAALAGECAHLTSECVAALSGPALDDEDELVRERTVEAPQGRSADSSAWPSPSPFHFSPHPAPTPTPSSIATHPPGTTT